MKKLLSGILSLLLVLSLASLGFAENRLEAILAAGKITMATSPDFAPVEFIDPTKTGAESIVGADIELGKYIAEKLGVELVIEALDFPTVQGAVSQGKVDMAISGFAYTDERAESLELSTFYNTVDGTGQGILVRLEDAEQLKTAADFAGKTVAVQNASLQYNLLVSQIPDAKVELITDLNVAIMMLITGKVDAVGVSEENGDAFAANYDSICMSDFYYDYSSEGNVLAVTKGETELIEKINEILLEVNELGLYEKWLADATELAATLGVDAE